MLEKGHDPMLCVQKVTHFILGVSGLKALEWQARCRAFGELLRPPE